MDWKENNVKRSLAILALMLISGCATREPPREVPPRLDAMLLDHRMVTLAEQVEDEHWDLLGSWLEEVLIPYVSWLESR